MGFLFISERLNWHHTLPSHHTIWGRSILDSEIVGCNIQPQLRPSVTSSLSPEAFSHCEDTMSLAISSPGAIRLCQLQCVDSTGTPQLIGGSLLATVPRPRFNVNGYVLQQSPYMLRASFKLLHPTVDFHLTFTGPGGAHFHDISAFQTTELLHQSSTIRFIDNQRHVAFPIDHLATLGFHFPNLGLVFYKITWAPEIIFEANVLAAWQPQISTPVPSHQVQQPARPTQKRIRELGEDEDAGDSSAEQVGLKRIKAEDSRQS